MSCKSMVKEPQKIFVAKEERVRSLENLLDSYPDVLKEPEIKNQIVRSFRFEEKATCIKLYDKKTLRRTEFVEKLEEFFFVGEAYFYPEPKDSKVFGAIILSRFKDLLDVGIRYAIKYKGQFDKVPDLSYVLFGTPFKKICPSRKQVSRLKAILNGFRDVFDDGYARRDILRAFRSRKLVTSIELANIDSEVLKRFKKELDKFFFVSQGYSELDFLECAFSGDIFVSHYKNLINEITYYSKDRVGVFDRFAGLAGVFLLDPIKYPLEKIAFYCFDKRRKKHHFIK